MPGHQVDRPLEVAQRLVALHATDPASVFLAAAARLRTPRVVDVEGALYEQRSVVRMLGMRRTMFVVPVELAPVVQAACTRAIAVQERRRSIQLFEQAGLTTDGDAWLSSLEAATLAALAERGEATAAELGALEPRLKTQIAMAVDKPYAGKLGVSTRVLFGLAAEGRIMRGRPRGAWTSSQYRWALTETWLGAGLAELGLAEAQTELVRRWLKSFGPGTAADLKWWTGLTMGEVRRALATVGAREVDLDGQAGFVLADDEAPLAPGEPWVALLPALDPTPMGWAQRGWFLGESAARPLFDRSGNIGPSVWCDGRIVGGWAQRADGEVALRLLEDVGDEMTRAIESRAEQLSRWLGATRVTPRFRTPLEKELAAG